MTAFPSTSASVSNFSGTGEDTQSIVNDLDALVANAANYANVALTAANTATSDLSTVSSLISNVAGYTATASAAANTTGSYVTTVLNALNLANAAAAAAANAVATMSNTAIGTAVNHNSLLFANVLDYGAIPTDVNHIGAHDCTAAFEAAMAVGPVYLPSNLANGAAAYYAISNCVVANGASIIGSSNYGYNPNSTGSVRPFVVPLNNTTTLLFNIDSATGLKFEGFNIDCLGQAALTGNAVPNICDAFSMGSVGLTMRDMYVGNARIGVGGGTLNPNNSVSFIPNGTWIFHTDNVEFENCWLGIGLTQDTWLFGTNFSGCQNGMVLSDNAGATNFNGCRFEWCGRTNAQAPYWGTGGYGLVLTGTNTSGIAGSPPYNSGEIHITGGEFDACGLGGIHLNWTSVVNITGTHFTRNGGNPAASFTANCVGTKMIVSNVVSGTLALGQVIGTQNVAQPATIITAQVGGTTGGVGTYTVSLAQTFSASQMTTLSNASAHIVVENAYQIGIVGCNTSNPPDGSPVYGDADNGMQAPAYAVAFLGNTSNNYSLTLVGNNFIGYSANNYTPNTPWYTGTLPTDYFISKLNQGTGSDNFNPLVLTGNQNQPAQITLDSPSGVYRQIDFTTNTVQRWSFAVDSSTENTVVYPTTIANSTGSIMHFANTSGVYTGMLAFAGYELGSTWTQYFPANTTVTAVTANTVTMSANATNAVALGTNITFGTNQGSNLFLQSMNDDGSDLATLLNFNRQTGDIVMDTASLYVSGDMGIGGGLSAGGYVVCDYMQVQTTNSDATVVISANASQNRQFVFQTGANNRWTFAADNTPESGTAIGSDFLISNYNNSGAFINNPLTIYRSNGVAVFSNAVSAPSFTQTSTTNTSGYTTMPDGTIMQFGTGTLSAGSYSIAFPKAFPSAVKSVTATITGQTTAATYGALVANTASLSHVTI